jgi:hypothetical protein
MQTFTRLQYDQCAFKKSSSDNDHIFALNINSNLAESNNRCFQLYNQNPFASIPSKLIDIESDLTGINRRASKCPSTKFDPNLQKIYTNYVTKCRDTDLLDPEYTQLKKSCNPVSQYDYSLRHIHPNKQEIGEFSSHIQANSYQGSNTRNVLTNFINMS